MRRIRSRGGLALAIMGLVAATTLTGPAAAESQHSESWTVLTFSGVKPTRFAVQDEIIGVVAEDSSSLIYRKVTPDEQQCMRLAWSWRVDQASDPTDLTRRGGDDRPLAVHLLFPQDRSAAGPWDRLSGALASAVSGLPDDGYVLTYVWGGIHEPGRTMENPYLQRRGHLIVLRNGDAPTGRWFGEQVDFKADFRAAFGHSPPPPTYVAVSGDADDTDARSAGSVARLGFVRELPGWRLIECGSSRG